MFDGELSTKIESETYQLTTYWRETSCKYQLTINYTHTYTPQIRNSTQEFAA